MRARAQIEVRLRPVSTGNFGDCKAVGEGVSQLRIEIGSGYRVYYGKHGRASWHRRGGALPITVTQGQSDFGNPAGGTEVGRDAAVGGAGESGACLTPCG